MQEKKMTGFNTISVLSVFLLIYTSGSLVAPALSSMAAQFPDAQFTTIKLIMTSMYLTVAVFSIVSGQLSKFISKKTLVLAGLAIYGVCGIIAGNMNTVNSLIAVRLIMGVGVGLVYPQANALVIEFYEGKKRETLMGYGSGISNLGSMLGSIIGGAITVISWRYNFYGFAVALVIFVIVLVGVPATPVVKSKTVKKDKSGKKLPAAFWALVIGMFFTQVFNLVTPTNMSLFYNAEQIGPVSLLGVTMALITGTSMVTGFILPYIRKVFKKYTFSFAFLCVGVGFVILANTVNVATTMLAQIMLGLGCGILLPLLFIENAIIVEPEQRQLSISILSCMSYFASFMTAYVQKWIQSAIGTTDFRAMFMVFAYGGFILAVILLIARVMKKKEA